jgi:hypothetical protein
MTEQEIIENYDPKELLLMVMQGMEVDVIKEEGKFIHTINNYVIEVEGKSLYKLMHNGFVVSPFADVVEMCGFIKMG